jgi:ribonucleoside-diphosphate reductase alpha chain
MFVINRQDDKEKVSFDKILERIKLLSENNLNIDCGLVAQKIVGNMYCGISTTKLDELSARICVGMFSDEPAYGDLARNICINNLHKNTSDCLLETYNRLYNISDKSGNKFNLISKELLTIITNNADKLNDIIDYKLDYKLDFFGFKTLEKSYLLKLDDSQIIERPQHMFMRVALAIHGNNIDKVEQVYKMMANQYFTHATPTLFNAGTERQQMSSCFLAGMEDSIESIFETSGELAKISKWAGGIGLSISNIRSDGSLIRGTGGKSSGIMPLMKMLNSIATYINQGGKRNGSFAIYLEPHHPDIFTFLDSKKNHGADEIRARDLFYALWVSDLFMERVKNDDDWALLCPDTCKGLCDVYGDEFKSLYEKYEGDSKFPKKIVKARDVWSAILSSQIETGGPYILYKDACNKKSNQKNIGVIHSSNLCVAPETFILTDKGQLTISSLKDQEVNVWNGTEFSATKVVQTNKNTELVDVSFSDGSLLTCTPYHKFFIQEGYNKKSVSLVEAQKLEKGMKLIKCNYPVINNDKELVNAYTNGMFTGDGTYTNIVKSKSETKCRFKSQKGYSYCKRHIKNQKGDELSDYCEGISYTKKNHITLYGEKIKLLKYLDYDSVGKEKDGKLNVTLAINLKDKFFVPMNYSLKSKMDWLSGYCDADGTIAVNQCNKSLQITSIEKEFLIKVKLMLQTCGINSKVTMSRIANKEMLPDGKGGYKEYERKDCYRLLIASNELQSIVKLGFDPHRLEVKIDSSIQRSSVQFITVVSITNNDRKDDTYCFTEEKEHKGIFNGVITSQCAEIIQYSDSKETAVCNLASICLPRFLEEKINESYMNTFEGIKLKSSIEKYTNISIYTKEDCVYCKLLKVFFTKVGIPYKEISKDEDDVLKIKFPNNNYKTVPRVYNETEYLGGYEEAYMILKPKVNYKKLAEVSGLLVENLNNIIDSNFYPTEKTRLSNNRHRPMGIGVQGLADIFIKLRIGFDSDEAIELNKKLFETIYYGAMKSSIELSKKHGTYDTFKGSPLSEGKFQFDLWNLEEKDLSGFWDWKLLRKEVIKYGARNSLLIAVMPTASTSQIMGNNECIEPYTSNLYVRRTIAGEFTVVNKHLVEDLISINLWDNNTRDRLLYDRGSVKNIKNMPEFLKNIYKTVWEIKQKKCIDLSVDRAPFVCQSQSLNIWLESPTFDSLTSIHFYGWSKGLKTGSYYIRSKAKVNPKNFSMNVLTEQKMIEEDNECENCSG